MAAETAPGVSKRFVLQVRNLKGWVTVDSFGDQDAAEIECHSRNNDPKLRGFYRVSEVEVIDRDEENANQVIKPRRSETPLTDHVRTAARDKMVGLPKGLALLYWDGQATCRAFSLNEHGMHFSVPELNGVYTNTSEIIPV